MIDAEPTAVQESDDALVRRALGGDADAFASLFHRHKRRVYAICLRMTNNTAEADDLTQEVFLQVFRKLDTFRGEAALSTWLYRLAVNSALMHFRRQPRPHIPLEGPGERDGAPLPKREYGRRDDRLSFSLERIALARALNDLPHGYRAIFELHEIKGYGHREIAQLLRCSVGNSKSQLHKAKQRIREFLFPRSAPIQHLQQGGDRVEACDRSAPRRVLNVKPVSGKNVGTAIELEARKMTPQDDRPALDGPVSQGLAQASA